MYVNDAGAARPAPDSTRCGSQIRKRPNNSVGGGPEAIGDRALRRAATDGNELIARTANAHWGAIAANGVCASLLTCWPAAQCDWQILALEPARFAASAQSLGIGATALEAAVESCGAPVAAGHAWATVTIWANNQPSITQPTTFFRQRRMAHSKGTARS